jgi:hypothetical protein
MVAEQMDRLVRTASADVSILAVAAEAGLLLAHYPECGWSLTMVMAMLEKRATAAGVGVEV